MTYGCLKSLTTQKYPNQAKSDASKVQESNLIRVSSKENHQKRDSTITKAILKGNY